MPTFRNDLNQVFRYGTLVTEQAVQTDVTVSANEEAITTALRNAGSDLRAYRDQASPTNAQTVAAVKLLCRCMIWLVRRELQDLTSTD